MDCRTGEILTVEQAYERMLELHLSILAERQRESMPSPQAIAKTLFKKGYALTPEQTIKPMKIQPTETQLNRLPPRVGRNEPCPCGSGRKFKKCCLITEKG